MVATVANKIYEFEDFRLIPGEGLLLRNGTPISLNPKAFAVLVMLVENHGHLVSRSEILDAIWEGSFIEESAVSKAVWFVRNALGDTSKERFIATVPRRGYRFIAPVSIVNHSSGAFRLPLPPEAAEIGQQSISPSVLDDNDGGATPSATQIAKPATVPTDATAPGTLISGELPANAASINLSSFSGRRRWITYAGIAVFLLSVASIYLALNGRNLLSAGGATRIAVLPLKPLNEQSREPFFDLGLAEALILKLSSRKDLTVRSLSSVRVYKDIRADPLSVGKEQNVDYVLSSNYQIAGGRIRVTAQFLNVATGNVEETFQVDYPLDSLFAAQDGIANDIGNQVLARFGSDPGVFRTKRGTENQEAYRFYMMAMNLSEERGVQNLHKALAYLELAVDMDPNYALAWAGKAHLHRDIVGHSDPDVKGHYEKSMEAIRRALAIDPNLSDAYSALCNNKNRYEYDSVGAEAACKRALELDPDSPQAHKTYANFLYSRGRFDEAINHIRTAMDLQPVSYRNQQIYGLTLFYARRFEEAEAQFKRLLELNPNHNYINGQLVTILEAQGKESEACDYFVMSLMRSKADNGTIERFRTAYAESGWRGVTMERIKAEDKTRSFHLACLYARIGDKDKAFEYLGKAYLERSFMIPMIQVAPQLDSLRDDPRYGALVRRIEGG